MTLYVISQAINLGLWSATHCMVPVVTTLQKPTLGYNTVLSGPLLLGGPRLPSPALGATQLPVFTTYPPVALLLLLFTSLEHLSHITDLPSEPQSWVNVTLCATAGEMLSLGVTTF